MSAQVRIKATNVRLFAPVVSEREGNERGFGVLGGALSSCSSRG